MQSSDRQAGKSEKERGRAGDDESGGRKKITSVSLAFDRKQKNGKIKMHCKLQQQQWQRGFDRPTDHLLKGNTKKAAAAKKHKKRKIGKAWKPEQTKHIIWQRQQPTHSTQKSVLLHWELKPQSKLGQIKAEQGRHTQSLSLSLSKLPSMAIRADVWRFQ